MFAVLGFCDGFGNDTEVIGIYPTYELAQICAARYHKEDDPIRYKEFDFGEVDFDYYEANPFYDEKHKKKKG